MKKILNHTFEEDGNEKNALTRKLYRYICEAVKKVDEGTSRSKSISDLFTPSLEVYRQKLRDNCEKLIFADPLLYGRKAQELLWRKGYYEVVATSKRLRQSCKDQEQLVLSHIDTGVGHYHNLISKIQHEMGVHINLPIDYPQTEIQINKQSKSDDIKEFVKSFVQTSLIYLGDLCRYKTDYDETWAFAMSYRYYIQAANVDANVGMPYNQLGTLHTLRNHHLDSVSYYLTCLACNTPFDGAEGNLIKIFDKNNKYLENININPDIIDQQESIKIMICKFLSLVEHWFFEKPIANFNEVCTGVLYDIKECLRFQPLMTADEAKSPEDYTKYVQQNEICPDHLTSNVIHRMTVILLELINKLHKENSADVMSLKSFALTILSQLLHKLHDDFVSFGFDKDVVSKIIEGFKEKIRNQKNVKSNNLVKLLNGFHNTENISSKDTDNKQDGIINGTVEEENEITTNHISLEEPDKIKENIGDDIQKNESDNLVNGDIDATEKMKNKNRKPSVLQKLRRRKRNISGGSSESSDTEDDDASNGNSDSNSEDSGNEDQQMSTDESDDADENIDSYSTTTSEDEEDQEHGVINGEKCNEIINDAKEIVINGRDDMKIDDDKTVVQLNIEGDADNIVEEESNKDAKDEKPIEFNEKMFQEFLHHNNILVGLHLMLNWLFGESELILSFGASGRPMFLALVNVLNSIHGQIFPKLSWNNYSLSNQFHPSLKSFHELFFSLKYNGFRRMPVAEDYNVKSLEICNKGLKYIDWDKHKKTKLTEIEANTIRLMKIVDFGAYIVKLNVGIVFNKRLKLYLLKKTSNKKPNFKKYGKGIRDVHTKSQRSYKPRNNDPEKGAKPNGGSLMKNLGRLWLSEQVRALESEVGGKKLPNLPAYVILDADALCQQTHLVKQLVNSKRLIVLVPTIVLHTMDELKKESGAARSAIRWLETQLSNGSRFIRAQRPNENTPLPCVKYPKKVHRHVQNFIQIVEFCNFFLSNDTGETSIRANMNGSGDSNAVDTNKLGEIKMGRSNDTNSNNLVVLLVGSNNLYTEQKDFSYKGLARSAGISMEGIQDFCFRWRHCLGKGSKKR